MPTFAELGVDEDLLSVLQRQNISAPLEVQVEAMPALMEGRDVVIEAPTGSGKSLAFLIPLVQQLWRDPSPGPRALVMCPTRELAIQVHKVFESLESGHRCALLYGGVGYATQTQALNGKPDVIIGTPGRILDMVERRLLALSRVTYLVLDEADEMLDTGFARDVEKILGLTYQPQMTMASATMPTWVSRMIDKHMDDPVRVRVRLTEGESRLQHALLRVETPEKLAVLTRLLQLSPHSAIVFGRTKHGVQRLCRDLLRRGTNCAQLHGDMPQSVRDRTMESFRAGAIEVLVATNVAARGLDISHVGLIVNYDLPDTPQWLTHRIGRTARNGAAGHAITLLSREHEQLWRRLLRDGAKELPELDGEALLQHGRWQHLGARSVPAATERVREGAERSRGRRGGRRRRPRAGGPAQPSPEAA